MRFGTPFALGSPLGIVPINLSSPAIEEVRVEFDVFPGPGTDPEDRAFSWVALFRWATLFNENPFPVERLPVGRDRQYLLQVVSSPVPVTQSNFVLTVVGDSLPTLQVSPAVYFVEGALQGAAKELQVMLSHAIPMAAEFEYSFDSPGTFGYAVAGRDFLPLTGKMVFPPGVTSAKVAIPILDDTERENEEIFAMRFRNPVNLILTDSVKYLWIVDDDAPTVPRIEIKEVSGGLLLLEIESEGTASYQFEQSSVLEVEDWRPLGAPFRGNGYPWRQRLSVPVSTGTVGDAFYRVVVTP